MYARTVIGMGQPDRIEEAIRIYRESVLPAAREQKGFKGIFFLVDRGTGKAMSMVLWETEADMEVGEASGYLREQIAKLAPTFAAPPVTEHFEVLVQGMQS